MLTTAIAMSQSGFSHGNPTRASEEGILVVDLNKECWYDLDGDGKREFYQSNVYVGNRRYKGLFRLNEECNLANYIIDSYRNLGSDAMANIVNFGLDIPGFAYGGSKEFPIYKTNGTEDPVPIDTVQARSVNFIDIDNNGTNDIWLRGYNNDANVAIMGPDERFMYRTVKIMSPQEYYDYIVEKPSSGLGSGMSVIDISTGTPGCFGSFQQIDINNDGLMDYILPSTGEYLMNIGDGAFMKSKFAGKIYFRDFNDDGLNDMLSYNDKEKQLTVTYQNKDGEPETKKLVSGMACGDKIWCHDFDKDGDIDILVPFNGLENNEQGYLIMLENKGDGSFKKHEHYIDKGQLFLDCADVDNDGNYEVFFLGGDTYYGNDMYVWYLKVTGVDVDENAVKLHDQEPNDERIALLDANNSGFVKLYSYFGSYPDYEYKSFSFGDVPNTRPEKMAKPSVVYNEEDETIEISWDLGADKETASLDLTYELRIGTAPDKCDILWVDALADGHRRNFKDGNCGYLTMRKFNTTSWPEGKIYISIQSIDGNYMGSEFSDYAIVEKKTAAADFLIDCAVTTAVTEEVKLRFFGTPDSSVTYGWDFDGAEIVSENGVDAVVKWATPGTKKISLTATTAVGKTRTETKELKVVPAKLVPDKKMGEIYLEPSVAVDLDFDGVYELFDGRFYEANADGEYNLLKRLFNNNLPGGGNIADINRDGMPDVYCNTSNKISHTLNLGDKDMEIVDFDNLERKSIKLFADLDNDGFSDGYFGVDLGYNRGNYKSMEDITDLNTLLYWGTIKEIYDYDGDGFMDLCVIRVNNFIDWEHVYLYRNLGNRNFELDKTISVETSVKNIISSDIDGDGKMDMVSSDYASGLGVTSYSDYVYVYWGDGTNMKIPAPAGHQFCDISEIADLDNNGCNDIILDVVNGESVSTCIIFFYSDRSYEIVNCGERRNFGEAFFRRADGRMGLGANIVIGPGNTLPTAPTGIKMTETDDFYVFSWDAASDAETPVAGLKYNISLKLKDKEGDNSYVWSPLNGGMNGVPVPSSAQLLVSTTVSIPKSAVGPGDYEFKVQAVDTQMECGDFSEAYGFSVSMNNFISGPSETMVNKRNMFRLFPGIDASTINFGEGAVVESVEDKSITVYWTSEGEKNITYGEYSKAVFVHPALDASFYIPEEVFLFSKVNVNWDNDHNSEWKVEGLPFPGDGILPSSSNNYGVTYTQTEDNSGYLTIGNNNGSSYYKLRITHTLTESYGTDSYSVEFKTVRMKENPTITLVDIDEETNKHRIRWSVPEELRSGLHRAYMANVYKETSEFGVYELLSTMSADDYTSHIDEYSDPDKMASRYSLSYKMGYGETMMSVAHQPIHLQINQGGANIWNLYWGKYEGRNITTYRILRGNSPQTLECIAEVSGNVTSYTDYDVPTDAYYAVEILLNVGTRATETLRSRSNVVSVSDSGVDDVLEDGFYVVKEGNSMTVISDADVTVVNAQGIVIYTGKPCRIDNLSKGLYIVKSDKRIRRVMI